MTISKFSLLYIILKLFLIVIGIGFSILAAAVFHFLLTDFSWAGLLGLGFYSLFGFSGLLLGISSIQWISIDVSRKVIVVSRCLFFKTRYGCEELTGCRPFTFRNKYGAYKAFFVQTQNGSQFAYTELDFTNFTDVSTAIKQFVPHAKERRNHWNFTDGKLVISALLIEVIIYSFTLFII